MGYGEAVEEEWSHCVLIIGESLSILQCGASATHRQIPGSEKEERPSSLGSFVTEKWTTPCVKEAGGLKDNNVHTRCRYTGTLFIYQLCNVLLHSLFGESCVQVVMYNLYVLVLFHCQATTCEFSCGCTVPVGGGRG